MPPSQPGGSGGDNMDPANQAVENAQMLTMAIAVALQNHGDRTFNKVATSTFSNFHYELRPETDTTWYWLQRFDREVIIPSESSYQVKSQ